MVEAEIITSSYVKGKGVLNKRPSMKMRFSQSTGRYVCVQMCVSEHLPTTTKTN
jgi:hypothetical protein